jgi:hypothetical protein
MSEKYNEESNVLSQIRELAVLIEGYDKADQESDIALYAESNSLKNLKQALAEKLSTSTGKTFSECQIEAEELVSQVEQDVNNPTIKKRICSTLKLLSNDLNTLSVSVVSSVLATLATGGVISLPILPALPGITIAIGGFILTRAGVEYSTFNNSKGQ